MIKAVILTLMLFRATQGAQIDDHDRVSTTSQIRAAVNQTLENFRLGMNRYFERTGNSKRIPEMLINTPDRKERDERPKSKKRPDVSTPLNPPAIPDADKPHEKSREIKKSQFKEILDGPVTPQNGPTLPHRLTNFLTLTQLIISGKLQNNQKTKALKNSDIIRDPDLKKWLNAYDQKAKKYISPAKILPFIISKILKGESVKDIRTLLRSSKRVNSDLLSSPVELQLDDQYGSAALVNGQVLTAIAQLFPKINRLSLRNCKALNDKDLECLKKLEDLTALSLEYILITNEGLKSLQDIKNLKHLYLDGTSITDEGLQSLVNLTILSLAKTAIQDRGLTSLQSLAGLRSLNLSGTSITDEGLKSLQNLKDLWDLSLEDTSITDKGLKSLQSLTGLTYLNLGGTPITNEALKILENLENLKILNLRNTSITEDGLKSLRNFKYLTNLDLRGVPITDKVLKSLESLKNLTTLFLSEESKVTASGVEQLKTAFPQLELFPAFDWLKR